MSDFFAAFLLRRMVAGEGGAQVQVERAGQKHRATVNQRAGQPVTTTSGGRQPHAIEVPLFVR